jgi:hypothetical protein
MGKSLGEPKGCDFPISDKIFIHTTSCRLMGSMQKRALVGMIFVLVALIMFGISLAMPWYYWEVKISGPGGSATATVVYYLDHFEINELGESIEFNYEDENIEDMHFSQTFRTTQIISLMGIIGCILGLIGAAMVMLEKISSKIGALLVLIAVIFSLIAPIYLMIALPGAFKEDADEPSVSISHGENITVTLGDIHSKKMGTDFFGSDKNETQSMGVELTEEYTWGGSTGWFLTFFAAIICIIALFLVAMSKPTPAPTFQEAPMPLDMYAQPYDIQSPQQQAQFYPDQEAFTQYPSPLQMIRPQGEEFQCPSCSSIFILTFTKRPAIIRCPYCGLEGLAE